jgi:glycosyltransferase involved in cell wall biosynthesis
MFVTKRSDTSATAMTARMETTAIEGEALPEPLIAVVIPVYKHSVLLVEALKSVYEQVADFRIVTFIVDDGCPYPETGHIAASFAASNPDTYYVRKKNGGLSSARNFGIDMALSRFPSIRAIYLLDADNRLSPTTLKSCFDLLDPDNGVGWIYPNIDKFGVEWCGNFTANYSKLLHITYDNICEAGSLVAREIFDRGIRFDENMLAGCEDWEFWLQCLDAGFVGKNNPFFGFEYRMRGESMVSDTARDIVGIRSYMRKKHPALHSFAKLIEFEHQDEPRFITFSPGTGEALLFTDPSQPKKSIIHDDALLQLLAGQMEPDSYGLPDVFTWFKPEAIQRLTDAKLSWTVFNLIEKLVQKYNFVAVSLDHSDTEIKLEIQEVDARNPLGKAVHGWATRQALFRDVLKDPFRDWVNSLRNAVPDPNVVQLRLSASFGRAALKKLLLTPNLSVLSTIDASDMMGLRLKSAKRWSWRVSCLPEVSYRPRLGERMLESEFVMPRMPVTSRPQIGFALPISVYGGVERVAFAVATELWRKGCDVHLFCFGLSEVKIFKSQTLPFSSINFFAESDYSLVAGSKRFMGHDIASEFDDFPMTRKVLGFLAGMDVIVNCHVAPVNAVAGRLRRGGVKIVNHLHVIDSTPYSRPAGHPYIGLAFEHATDLYLTCSQALKHWLHGNGVPLEKIEFVENAGGYVANPDRVEQMRQQRARHQGQGPVRIAFIGRLDTQKGVERMLGTIDACRKSNLDFQWRVIGSEIISVSARNSWAAQLANLGVQLEKPIYDPDRLSDILSQTDVFLLPSRWEGAPLAIIEAQRLGCVPIATDVGAVAELIIDNEDGILIADRQDDAVVDDIVAALVKLDKDRALLSRLSSNAIDRGARTNWQKSCALLVAAIRKWFPGKPISSG